MTKYAPDFKYRVALHYHQVHSRQRTADHLNFSRTHLRRWLAAYRQGGIASVLSWNKKKVGRIMGLLGLKAKVRSKRTYRPQAIGEAAANILNREFNAAKSQDKWLIDVTGFKCTDGKLRPLQNPHLRRISALCAARSFAYLYDMSALAALLRLELHPHLRVLQRSQTVFIADIGCVQSRNCGLFFKPQSER